jgi:RNA polymerase sigma-B factor
MTASVIRLATRVEDQSDQELVRLVQSLPRDSVKRDAACEALVARHQSLVRRCALRYRRSPEPQEELMQVGYVGLLKAINNFDPEVGRNLAAYAQSCISGEIKRHFRDKRWQVHVKRSVQELRQELRQARSELTQRLARLPRSEELAIHLGVSDDDLREALQADLVFQTASLDAPFPGEEAATPIGDLMGGEDPRLEHALDIQSVRTHLDELPARQQKLLMMRFYGNMSQAEIGERLGISQMHVSRLLAAALEYLRGRIVGPDADQPG